MDVEKIVEAIALALYQCEAKRSKAVTHVVQGINPAAIDYMEPFEDCADTTWRPDARAALRAALEAMREPSEGLLWKGWSARTERGQTLGDLRQSWSAMIDQARKELGDV